MQGLLFPYAGRGTVELKRDRVTREPCKTKGSNRAVSVSFSQPKASDPSYMAGTTPTFCTVLVKTDNDNIVSIRPTCIKPKMLIISGLRPCLRILEQSHFQNKAVR